MEQATLGRTGLRVGVAGLGCGGPSRLGLRSDSDEAGAERVVRRALELGVTLFDTAEAYGTEEIVGRALEGRRDEVVISTKAHIIKQDGLRGPDEIRAACEASLVKLRTDRIDVFHMHGILPAQYGHVREHLVPQLEKLRADGKIRFIAISEAFGPDPGHRMLPEALADGVWDVVMVGLNILNSSARDRVLPLTRAANVGTLCMFPVRRVLSRPEKLREAVAALVESGDVDGSSIDPDDPLGFVPEGVVDAAYRYARDTEGIDVVLTGTGSVEHLGENVRSLSAPPLPAEITARLTSLFARVDHVSGN